MKTHIKVESQEQKENVKNSRKTLKILQQTACNKENLAGRPIIGKDSYLASSSIKPEQKTKKVEVEDKAVQTGEAVVTAADLTSEEPSADYWKKLAEKRQDMLDESFKENEQLKEQIEALEDENRICKEMLDESRQLVEVLQEMLQDDEGTEVAEEATEEP